MRSADPFDDPLIRANYFSAEKDWQVMLDGIGIVRELAEQPSLKSICAREMNPGPRTRTVGELKQWIRQSSGSQYHPVGTCKMGASNDELAVVDSALKVRGVEGLRIADASVMPVLIGGNTNAPSIMIGEKAADLILGRSAA